jgi:hypothetical protein
VQPKWFEAGAKDYGWSPLALTTLEFLLLGFLEVKRYQGFKKTGQARPPPPNTLHRPGTVSAGPAGLRPAGSCSSVSCLHHCAREALHISAGSSLPCCVHVQPPQPVRFHPARRRN